MRRSVGVAIGLLLFAFAGFSATAQKLRSGPEDALRTADQQWMKVFAARDVAKSVAFCTTDGSVLAPNSPIATGHEAIGKLFTNFYALPNLKISWTPERVQVAKSGELGYTSGSYQMTFSDPSGKTIPDTGKYVTVWKKQGDGSWKVALDIFNTDLAMPNP